MKKWLFYIFFVIPTAGFGQKLFINDTIALDSSVASKTINYTSRKWVVGSASLAVYGASFIILNHTRYKGYPRSKFHTFNDWDKWLQMDKAGHAWTAYNTSRITTRAWQWAGMNRNQATMLGTGSNLLYLLSIEYLDGRSAEWGWSWSDVGGDFAGAALFAAQELGWKQQKIQLKLWASLRKYNPPALQNRANDIFGKSLPERLLKDYNAQTYWLSFNINSFVHTNLPNWLNIAVGYGAEGMWGGFDNIAYDKNGSVVFDRRDIKRYRQWYLGPDIDFTRVKTKSKFLKTIFEVLYLVLPVPSLEFSNNKFRFALSGF